MFYGLMREFTIVFKVNFTNYSLTININIDRLLDREKVEIIKLVITVEDMAAIDDGPVQIASDILTIIVQDENDNNPKFRKSFYKTSITENSKPGMHIETVIADDADKNRTMTYILEGKEKVGYCKKLYRNL